MKEFFAKVTDEVHTFIAFITSVGIAFVALTKLMKIIKDFLVVGIELVKLLPQGWSMAKDSIEQKKIEKDAKANQ